MLTASKNDNCIFEARRRGSNTLGKALDAHGMPLCWPTLSYLLEPLLGPPLFDYIAPDSDRTCV